MASVDFMKHNKKGISMNKKRVILIIAMLLLPAAAAMAGDYDKLIQINQDLNEAGQKTVGPILKTTLAWLPVLLLGVGGIGVGAYVYEQNKQERKNPLKVGFWAFIGVVAGAMVGTGIDLAIGAFLFGDSAQAMTVFTDYWKAAAGVSSASATP